MPQIAFTSADNARSELLALMTYPDDDAARRRWQVVAHAAALTSEPGARPLTLAASDVRTLLEAPSFAELRADQRKRVKDAYVAGGILAGVFIMDRFGMSPSLNRSLRAYRAYAATTTYGDHSVMPISEPKMRECWNRFAPVAPLWAALTLNKEYPFASERALFSANTCLPCWASPLAFEHLAFHSFRNTRAVGSHSLTPRAPGRCLWALADHAEVGTLPEEAGRASPRLQSATQYAFRQPTG